MNIKVAMGIMGILFVLLLTGCGNAGQQMMTPYSAEDGAAKQTPMTQAAAQAPQETQELKEPMIPETNATPKEAATMHTIVLLETTTGNIKIELFDDTMPITTGNFKKLVSQKFYDNVIFHRVIPDFMIQGGDPTGTGTGGPGYYIKDEFTANNKNNRGTIAMANAGPNTGASQFFISVANNNFLDKKHPVFGKVIDGMDVVDKIANAQRNANDKPLTDIVIKKASIVQ